MPSTINLVKANDLGGLMQLGAPTTAVLLNGHVVKVPFEYLGLFPQISASLNLVEKSFFCNGQ